MNATKRNPIWRRNVLLIGTLVGAVLGLIAGYMFVQTTETADSQTRDIRKRDAVRVAVGVADIIRTIAKLGS